VLLLDSYACLHFFASVLYTIAMTSPTASRIMNISHRKRLPGLSHPQYIFAGDLQIVSPAKQRMLKIAITSQPLGVGTSVRGANCVWHVLICSKNYTLWIDEGTAVLFEHLLPRREREVQKKQAYSTHV
jgi:hypothetical protein